MTLRAFKDTTPTVDPSCFVADSADVIGQVTLEAEASVWFNTVVRGDVNRIHVGARSNVQDLTVVHVTTDRFETWIGADVTVGHRAILHGCRVADRVLVGMGAILLDGVEVGEDCVVAAGALLTPGTRVPPGSLVMGSPARVKREVTEAERTWIRDSAAGYVTLARSYLAASP